MKIELLTKTEQITVKRRTRPVDYFKKCPKCGEKELIHVEADLLCTSCDWDSLAWDVSRGAMDDLQSAAKELFTSQAKEKPTQKSKENMNDKKSEQTLIGA